MDDEKRRESGEILEKYKKLPVKERIRVIIDTEELLEKQESGENGKMGKSERSVLISHISLLPVW